MILAQVDNQFLARLLSRQIIDPELAYLSPEDWRRMVERAQAEGVGPQIFWILSQSGAITLLPKAQQDHLRAMYVGTRMKNEQSLNELETLTRLYAQAGIPVVALKGISFLLTIYPDIGLRPMADLDLLVPAPKLALAVQIAKTLDYADAVPEVFPGLSNLLGDEISLQKTKSPFTMLELHNSLLENKSFTYAVPVEWFWGQTEPLDNTHWKNKTKELLKFSPNAQLLYAAAHTMLKHGSRNASLRWMYDIDRMISIYGERMDWEQILEQAKVFQWGSALQAALIQTHKYFNSPIPDYVFVTLSEYTDRHQKIVKIKEFNAPTRILEEYNNLRERKWYGWLILILGLVIPSPAYMRWRYGFKTYWVLPLWYLYRWWGIVADVMLTLKMEIQMKFRRK